MSLLSNVFATTHSKYLPTISTLPKVLRDCKSEKALFRTLIKRVGKQPRVKVVHKIQQIKLLLIMRQNQAANYTKFQGVKCPLSVLLFYLLKQIKTKISCFFLRSVFCLLGQTKISALELNAWHFIARFIHSLQEHLMNP